MERPKRLAAALNILVAVTAAGITLAAAPVTPSGAGNAAQFQGARSPAQQADAGQAIYTQHCTACHGDKGDGSSTAADNMDPKPRDFRRGWYKIRTTASGQLPTDEDLFQVIARGMPGTTMPGWQGILTDGDIRAVATYIKKFARRFEREKPTAIQVGSKIASSPESIARGREIFQGAEAECTKCHGTDGRGDGPSADELTEDAFGDAIFPADLTMPWLFRGGVTADDISMRLRTGMTGGPMPSYADVLSNEDIWNLANYVDSLAPDAPPKLETAILGTRILNAIPDDPKDEAWQQATPYYYPLFGQIMVEPRNYTPAVAGVWVRALFNDQEIALLVKWHDRFHDTGEGGTGAQGGKKIDGFAVEFPAQMPQADKRPYFVLGDPSAAVNLWAWDASSNAAEERTARGVSDITVQATQNVKSVASFENGEYTLIVRRALKTGDSEDIPFETGKFVPIAFIAWDGWQEEQITSGAISSWYSIYLEEPTPAIAYAWIPAAILITALIELGIVWAVRRRAAQGSQKDQTNHV